MEEIVGVIGNGLQVSTFSLTAAIIVEKSFLRIQVIAYISTTDSVFENKSSSSFQRFVSRSFVEGGRRRKSPEERGKKSK